MAPAFFGVEAFLSSGAARARKAPARTTENAIKRLFFMDGSSCRIVIRLSGAGSGFDATQVRVEGLFLQCRKPDESRSRQGEQFRQPFFREWPALGRPLDLDEETRGRADNVAVHIRLGILLVGQIEDGLAGADADRDGGHGLPQRPA